MFGLFKDRLNEEVDDVLKRHEQLLEENKKLRDQIAQMRLDHIDALNKAVNKDVETAEFAMDFKSCNAFAIERNAKDGKAVTIVGHYANEPVAFTDGNVANKQLIKEWFMYCSQEQHNKLVAEFNKTVGKK